MKFTNHILAGCVALMAFAGTSCVGDLDLTPNDPNIKLELTTQAEWDGFLGRIYANLYRDDIISTSNGGAGTFTRTHFNLNEIVADECFISEAWNDPGYQPLNKNQWSPDNEWIYAAFAREFFNAKMAAEFMSGMRSQGAALFDEAEVNARIAEASALRGLAYYQMIDLFGRGPWIDESSTTGATPPTYDRKQLFDAITAELETYVPMLKPAAEQAYGRVSREAGYMLLAKLYLNAEVYTGPPMWRECAEACKQVVSTGITLAPEYKFLFCHTLFQKIAFYYFRVIFNNSIGIPRCHPVRRESSSPYNQIRFKITAGRPGRCQAVPAAVCLIADKSIRHNSYADDRRDCCNHRYNHCIHSF